MSYTKSLAKTWIEKKKKRKLRLLSSFNLSKMVTLASVQRPDIRTSIFIFYSTPFGITGDCCFL